MFSPQRRLTAQTLLLIGAFIAGFKLTADVPAAAVFGLIQSDGAVTAARVEGTIWNGRIEGARLRGADLGDIEFSLHAPSLFLGRLNARFAMTGGSISGRGSVAAAPGGSWVLQHSTLEIDLGAATRYTFLGAPIQGSLTADIERLAVRRGVCAEASLDLTTDVLAAPARRLQGEAFDLHGHGECRGDDLVAMLAGESADGAALLRVAITPDLRYTLVATAQPARAEIAEALRALGFVEGAGALSIAMSGTIRTGS